MRFFVNQYEVNYLMRGGAWGEGSLEAHVEPHKGKNFPEVRPHYE